MARPMNYDLRDRIFEYLEWQWKANGEKTFSCSLTDLAKEVGEEGHEYKIMYYINGLVRAGRLNVEKGRGAIANKYSLPGNIKNGEKILPNFGDKEYLQKEYVNKDEYAEQINSALNSINDGVDQLYNITREILQENTINKDRIEFLQSAFNSLQLFGKTNDGLSMFTLPKGTDAEILIDNAKRESSLN
jgi:hypothetical protein